MSLSSDTENLLVTLKIATRVKPTFPLQIADAFRHASWQNAGRQPKHILTGQYPVPCCRACETAEIVCSALQVPLVTDPGWMEIDNGLIAGMQPAEAAISLPEPECMTPYTHYGKTGESHWEVYLRAGRNIQQLLDTPAPRTLVVAHGGILNMAMYALLGIPLQAHHSGARFMFHNTTFVTFTYEPNHNNWRLHHFDDRPHLLSDDQT